MAVILNNKKSTYGSPYCFYTLEYTNTENRTAISVDITFKVTSHLQYNNSSFGTGRTLKAQIYINGSWSAEQTLKSSSDSWSGTGNHTKTFTLTINGLNSTDTTLSNIKFKVNSNATDNACQLSSTSCSDITIPIGHTPPIIFSYTMTEASNSPVKNIVDGNVIAENLSIKQFEVSCQLSDSATPLKGGIYNNIYPYSTTDITIGAHIGDNWQVRFNLDCSQFSFVKSESDNSKIPIVARIIDSEDTQGVSGTLSPGDLYTYIPYTPPTIIESSINAKRTYQVTGNAVLSLEGTYYKSTDVLNQSSHITVGYKYWENKENPTIPSNYTNIPNANVTINNNGTFTISNYSLGNSFELNKSYKIKLKVTDQYKSYELSEPKTIPYGEALWTEYKDRVDFKKLTIQKRQIFSPSLIHTTTSSKTFSSQSDTKFTLVNDTLIGSEFSISNGGILIGKNVNHIKIDAQLWFSTGFADGDSCRIVIYKNSSVIAESGTRVNAANAYETAYISNKVISVTENDIIYLYGRNATAGRGTCSAGVDTTFVTVERID